VNILFLNNYHYIRGGAERVFFGEMDMMKRRGHAVAGFARRHSLDIPSEYDHFFPPDIRTDRIGLSWETVRTATEMFYSLRAKDGLRKLIEEFRPDIAHVHNMHGRLTASVLDLLAEKAIPVVMTLHDYKLACPNYQFTAHHRICEACKGGRYYKAVLNRCHKNSCLASAAIAVESYLNDRLIKHGNNIECFLSPSRFLKQKLIVFGWPENQIKFVPNFLNLPDFHPDYTPGGYFLYLGRLSNEKGIRTLIQAFSKMQNRNAKLLVVGDGPSGKNWKIGQTTIRESILPGTWKVIPFWRQPAIPSLSWYPPNGTKMPRFPFLKHSHAASRSSGRQSAEYRKWSSKA
jgi:glycosyltransferase involved in cell wall biosynthesis